MARRFVSALFFSTLATAAVSAENWPAWRGPSANGLSNEKGLPTSWTKEENVTWKLAMPDRSGATPIIWGDIIFLNVAEADKDSLTLWAVDRTKGDVLWKKPLGGGNTVMRKQNMSSPSPVTDGKRVFVMTGTGVFKAFDFKGNELWTRDIQKDYGEFGLNWGYASSPLLYEGSLYVQVLHGMKTDDPSYVMKVDPNTGKTVWKIDRPTQAIRESPDSYTTPAVAKTGAKTWELVITGGDAVTGHDPATGKELWRANGLNPENNPFHRIVASPVVIDGLIYAPSRVKMMLALKPGGRGDVTTSSKVWEFDRGPGRAHAGQRRQTRLRGRRSWRAPPARCEDRRGHLRPAAPDLRHLQLVAGAGRREGVHLERRWRHGRGEGGNGVRGARGEQARRVHAQLAGGLRRSAVPAHRRSPLLHRQARAGGEEEQLVQGRSARSARDCG